MTFVILLGILLAGCAGRDFLRPEPGSLVLGKTTRQAALERFGEPSQTGVLTKNGIALTSLTYSYASATGGAVQAGILPGRNLTLYFRDGVLVGYHFTSSYAKDNTDFDDSKARRIQKGAPRAQVVELLGPPHGMYLYPLAKNEGDEALAYLYVQIKVHPGFFRTRFEGYRKTLVVSYDSQGVVTDVEFVASGDR